MVTYFKNKKENILLTMKVTIILFIFLFLFPSLVTLVTTSGSTSTITEKLIKNKMYEAKKLCSNHKRSIALLSDSLNNELTIKQHELQKKDSNFESQNKNIRKISIITECFDSIETSKILLPTIWKDSICKNEDTFLYNE